MYGLVLLIRDYEWVHLVLGLCGNVLFVLGSVFFLFEALRQPGTWLFVVGSTRMLVGAAGNALIKITRIEGRGRLAQAAEEVRRTA
jgi:hypothetical protein